MSEIYNLTKQMIREIQRINKSGGTYNKQFLKDKVCEYIDDLWR